MTGIVSLSLLYDSYFRIADIESERKCKIIIPKSKSIHGFETEIVRACQEGEGRSVRALFGDIEL